VTTERIKVLFYFDISLSLAVCDMGRFMQCRGTGPDSVGSVTFGQVGSGSGLFTKPVWFWFGTT